MNIKERPAIALQPIESSQLHSIGHHAESNVLAIQFKNKDGSPGSIYHYENFDAKQFEEFKSAESIGSHFYKHIKPHTDKHPFTRIDKA